MRRFICGVDAWTRNDYITYTVNTMKGIIAIYKPKGPTSHDVVDMVRRATGEKRVGHAGTLDPLATGVLVIGVGRDATRQLGTIVKKEKEYIATIALGVNSTTDDEEGEKVHIPIARTPPQAQVQDALLPFVGHIQQVPPVYSAVHVDGKRAYKRAREGQEVVLKPRSVHVVNIKLLAYRWPILKIQVTTGPGAYIRALARDIGKSLGTGGYLKELERIRVGIYDKEKAVSLEEFTR